MERYKQNICRKNDEGQTKLGTDIDGEEEYMKECRFYIKRENKNIQNKDVGFHIDRC